VGIFEAERRGHTGEEDMLTSRVFGTLEILDRSKFLVPFLKQCGVELGEEMDPGRLFFNYWESTGKRTPDVILRDESILISVESKLGSQIDNWQLVEEYEDGIKAQKNFWLIAVTPDYTQPTKVEKAKSVLREKGYKDHRIKWSNWQQIYAIFRTNAKSGNETEQKLISDLLVLMKARGLGIFMGFDEAQLSSIDAFWPKIINYLEGCSALFGTLSSRLHEKGITCIEKGYTQEVVLLGSRGKALQDFKRWLPHFIAMRAWDNKWKERGTSQGLLVRFNFNPLELDAGYRLGLRKEKLQQMFSEKAQSCTLAERLHNLDNYSVSYYDQGYKLQNRVTGDSVNGEIFSSEALRDTSFLIIGRVFNQEGMASPKLVEEIEECLMKIRDIVNENCLYFSEQAINTFTPHGNAEDMEGLPSEGEPIGQESAED